MLVDAAFSAGIGAFFGFGFADPSSSYMRRITGMVAIGVATFFVVHADYIARMIVDLVIR